MKLLLIFTLATMAGLAADPPGRTAGVKSGQRIVMIGDSITKGHGFGNYDDPSPLNRLYDIATLLLQDNVPHPPPVVRVTCGWQGFDKEGKVIGTVDSLAAQMKYCIERGELHQGDCLIYEDAGQVDIFIHPAPMRDDHDIYGRYRLALREMILAAGSVITREHFVLMTMFDYGPRCKWCRWETPLDDGVHTGNDIFRDTAKELGVPLIEMKKAMDAANDHLVSKGWGRVVGPDLIHPNIYGNYVMVLATLYTLGYDIRNWKLDGLARHFRHKESGGDVATVWGFDKDPSDGEREELLTRLRSIVLETIH